MTFPDKINIIVKKWSDVTFIENININYTTMRLDE